MDKQQLLDMVEELSLNESFPLSEIPNMDLYAEQVVTFTENKLGKTKRGKDDKVLTKTMINNYTKDGLLISPTNKKYSKDHLILLSIILGLKNILSIKDIKSLLKPAIKNTGNKKDNVFSLEEIYSLFLQLKQERQETLIKELNNKLEQVKEKTSPLNKEDCNKIEWLILTMLLVSEANEYKRLAESIIDTQIGMEEM